MVSKYRRTRLVGQDMKTGEFAYVDQLINDGYYPNLKVLPKNYDPPQPVGQSIRLPLEPLFNPSPPNVKDPTVMVLIQQVDQQTGQGVILPVSTGSVANLRSFVWGVSPSGVSSTGDVSIGASATSAVAGVSSTGGVPAQLSFVAMNANIQIGISGVSSVGSVANLLPGSGFGQGGGFSSNGYGEA